MRGCEQVAAVCYRARGGAIEFLPVQTRGGRWTFPKGSAEPGLTHAQAAAVEAFEEAGVHGRMEEASFARYVRRKRRRKRPIPATPTVSAAATQHGQSHRSSRSTGKGVSGLEDMFDKNDYSTPARAEFTASTSAPGSFPSEPFPTNAAPFLHFETLPRQTR
jgi:ADP-ribose pyrophosphatase YjhB (NUDIX family)